MAHMGSMSLLGMLGSPATSSTLSRSLYSTTWWPGSPEQSSSDEKLATRADSSTAGGDEASQHRSAAGFTQPSPTLLSSQPACPSGVSSSNSQLQATCMPVNDFSELHIDLPHNSSLLPLLCNNRKIFDTILISSDRSSGPIIVRDGNILTSEDKATGGFTIMSIMNTQSTDTSKSSKGEEQTAVRDAMKHSTGLSEDLRAHTNTNSSDASESDSKVKFETYPDDAVSTPTAGEQQDAQLRAETSDTGVFPQSLEETKQEDIDITEAEVTKSADIAIESRKSSMALSNLLDSGVESGVETLLMMRRIGRNDKVSLPAPLSQAAIRPVIKPSPLSAFPVTASLKSGLRSSHPYYRSSRVLASPQVASVIKVKQSGCDNRTQKGLELQPRSQPPKLAASIDNFAVRAKDVRYEHQSRKPPALPWRGTSLLSPRIDRREVQVGTTPASPRIYIPPLLFGNRGQASPRDITAKRHQQSPIRSASAFQATRVAISAPRTAPADEPSKRPAVPSRPSSTPSLADGNYRSVSEHLHVRHHPYRRSAAIQPDAQRETPRYDSYFPGEQAPMTSPFRQSFIRSKNDTTVDIPPREQQRGREEPYGREEQKYRHPRHWPYSRLPPPPGFETGHPEKESLAAAERFWAMASLCMPSKAAAVAGSKRSASDDDENHSSSRVRSTQGLQHITPRLQVPVNTNISNPQKRARTDSAESSASGSGFSGSTTSDSPSNRMRYIPPRPASDNGKRYTTDQHASRAASLSSSTSHSSMSNSSGATKDMGSLLAQIANGQQTGSATETAQALAKVAQTLAMVAESLNKHM